MPTSAPIGPWFPFDRYVRYDELTALLQAVAEAHPNLVRFDSVGKSYEGRDICLRDAPTSRRGIQAPSPIRRMTARNANGVIKAKPGTIVSLLARYERAGVVRAEVVCGEVFA